MSNIKAIGTASEQQSPFFIKHKKFCDAWENHLSALEAKSIGQFSPWALHVLIKIKTSPPWRIEITKSTNSNVSIWLLHKSSSIEITKFLSKRINLGTSSFSIKRRKIGTKITALISPNSTALNRHYNLICKKEHQSAVLKFIETIPQLIEKSNELRHFHYDYQKKELNIKFNALIEDFDLVNGILSSNNKVKTLY